MVTKSASEMQTALAKCFETLGQPETIYSDDDAGFTDIFTKELERRAVQHIITRGHASFVERAIRTIRRWLFLRLEHVKGSWDAVLPIVIEKYNNASHNATGMTPNHAHDICQYIHVRSALEMRARKQLQYPKLYVGSTVRVLQTPTILTKEHKKSDWGATRKVLSIEKYESGVSVRRIATWIS